MGLQCVLVEHNKTVQHCYVGSGGWIFEGDTRASLLESKQDTIAQQAGRIHELAKELREAKELIVAFVTGNGDIDYYDKNGGRTYKLFLDDRDIANVAHDDVMSVTYDNRRRGNIYEVCR